MHFRAPSAAPSGPVEPTTVFLILAAVGLLAAAGLAIRERRRRTRELEEDLLRRHAQRPQAFVPPPNFLGIIVLVGAPGAGKSDFVQRHLAATAVVSLDELRDEVSDLGDRHDQRPVTQNRALARAVLTAAHHVRSGTAVTIDATSSSRAHRATWVELARYHSVPAIAVVIHPDADVAAYRNRALRSPVPGPSGFAESVPAAWAAKAHETITADLGELADEGFATVVAAQLPTAVPATPSGRRTHLATTAALTFAVILVFLLVSGCSGIARSETGGWNPPAGTPDRATAQAKLAGLRVAAPGSMDGYVRDCSQSAGPSCVFGQPWKDVDGNGCDQRSDVLMRDLDGAKRQPGRCKVVAGVLHDPYTDTDVTSLAKIQIDHVVPEAVAWRSGAADWKLERRVAFANDLANLVAVSGKANMSKGDKTPDQWFPPNPAASCGYARIYVGIKATYALTVTAAERSALSSALNACR
ncbi:AAA family ATPase [Actinokineospora enzanensis]|uniref:AAA family ATPase n=1 Tax=Actinokineospora enzanensis TaxID=155975 RepID=UPI00037E6AEE|nr:AAA family ATPase [Actinokineospora enzanensis]